MAAIVKPDIIQQSGVEISKDSIRLRRTFLVSNIEGDPWAIQTNAVAAAGIPVMGTAHPTVPAALVRGYDVQPLMAHDMALVVVEYGWDALTGGGEIMWESDTSLAQHQTDTDPSNPANQYKVYYWPDPANIGNYVRGRDGVPQGVVVSVLKPQKVDLVTKYFHDVPGKSAKQAQKEASAWVGKCNANTWDDRAPKTLLVGGFRSQRLGSSLYRGQYMLIERPETWTEWAQWTNPVTGRAPQNAKKNKDDPDQKLANVGSNGWRGVFSYDLVDFNQIGINRQV